METTNKSLLIYTINRISFFIFFIIIGAGGVVQILRRYRINYIYIFEINPIQQLTHFQIYTIGLLLMTMYFACMAVQDMQCMYGFEPQYRVLQPSFICFILFIWLMLWPVKHFQFSARSALLQTIVSCFTAPFNKVAFRHFFLADVMCSASVVFSDITFFFCFMTI